jgi:hypothetical protein
LFVNNFVSRTVDLGEVEVVRIAPPSRHDISKPVTTAEHGLLVKRTRFSTMDVAMAWMRRSAEFGFKAAGWDPILRPQAPKMPAAVVNLGYVLND